MSLVLKQNVFNIKNEDGTYMSLNVAAEESTEEKLSQIEAKGQETIASIPEDYTTLSNDVADLKEDLNNNKITISAKNALLECIKNVAWANTKEGHALYEDLEESLLYSGIIINITANFEQGTNAIYNVDSLDVLRTYLTVVGNYDNGNSRIITNYELSGNLDNAVSTITVKYKRASTNFQVNVTDWYNIYNWNAPGLVHFEENTSPGNYTIDGYSSMGSHIYGNNIRTMPVVSKGILPVMYETSKQFHDYYPIPIPRNANHFSITITPSNLQMSMIIWKYRDDLDAYRRENLDFNAWTTGQLSGSFTPDENLFIGMNIKNSSNTAMEGDGKATKIAIVFSEV